MANSNGTTADARVTASPEPTGDAPSVELPGAPHHRTAWVREADVEVTSTTARIDIYLDERELDLTVDGEVSLTNAVVIGADESPTPLGVFWVTDPLDFTTNPTGAYGAYALGLNGWSETLEEFNGARHRLPFTAPRSPNSWVKTSLTVAFDCPTTSFLTSLSEPMWALPWPSTNRVALRQLQSARRFHG